MIYRTRSFNMTLPPQSRRHSKLRAAAIALLAMLICMMMLDAPRAFCTSAAQTEGKEISLEDGEYSIEVGMTGGSGKASVSSPALLIADGGRAYAEITWSSPNYDYMIVGGDRYLNQSDEGMNSAFRIPIAVFDEEMPVTADTTAMGTPHEIEYMLTFYSDTISSKTDIPQEAAKRVVITALIIAAAGGILNFFVQRRRRA